MRGSKPSTSRRDSCPHPSLVFVCLLVDCGRCRVRSGRRLDLDQKESDLDWRNFRIGQAADYITTAVVRERQCASGKALAATNKVPLSPPGRVFLCDSSPTPSVHPGAQRLRHRLSTSVYRGAFNPKAPLYLSNRALALRCASPLVDNEYECDCERARPGDSWTRPQGTAGIVEQQAGGMFAHCKGPFWAIDDFSTCFEREYVMVGRLAVAKKKNVQNTDAPQLSPDIIPAHRLRHIAPLPAAPALLGCDCLQILPRI